MAPETPSRILRKFLPPQVWVLGVWSPPLSPHGAATTLLYMQVHVAYVREWTISPPDPKHLTGRLGQFLTPPP